MNEAQIKHDLIEPASREAGWNVVLESGNKVEVITAGRIIGKNHKGERLRKKPLSCDYVLEYKGRRLAVIEVKGTAKYYTHGLAQAKDYAFKLNTRFACCTNSTEIYGVDTLEATKDLRQLCEYELLLKKGEKKGTYYLPGKRLSEEPNVLTEEPQPLTGEPTDRNDETVLLKKELLLKELPHSLQEKISMLKKRESNKEKVSKIIINLCKNRPYKLSELSILLDKSENYISTEYIKPLLGSIINYKYPEVINHPEQAYKTL